MRLAEVLLRLGTALVAWMMLFTHFVWLAVLYKVGCGPDGDEMHRVLLGLAPFTCGFAFLLRTTRPFADIHAMLRWLGVPLGILMLLSARSIWVVAGQVNVEAVAICAAGAPAAWELAWAPVQTLTQLFVIALLAVEARRSS